MELREPISATYSPGYEEIIVTYRAAEFRGDPNDGEYVIDGVVHGDGLKLADVLADLAEDEARLREQAWEEFLTDDE